MVGRLLVACQGPLCETQATNSYPAQVLWVRTVFNHPNKPSEAIFPHKIFHILLILCSEAVQIIYHSESVINRIKCSTVSATII